MEIVKLLAFFFFSSFQQTANRGALAKLLASQRNGWGKATSQNFFAVKGSVRQKS